MSKKIFSLYFILVFFFFFLKSDSLYIGASQVTLVVKNLPANSGDVRAMNLIPGSGRSFEERNGNSLQHSYLENSMNR